MLFRLNYNYFNDVNLFNGFAIAGKQGYNMGLTDIFFLW